MTSTACQLMSSHPGIAGTSGRALDTQESALATRRQMPGNKHTDTPDNAWNPVPRTLDLDNRASVQDLLPTHRLTLFDADPASLGADPHKLRQQVPGKLDAVRRRTGLPLDHRPPGGHP